jgi:hypothetical protein
MKQHSLNSTALPPVEPDDSWPHKTLWSGVKAALRSLPAYFHSDTFIEGVNATDVFTLNAALGATIETQVVATLNQIRSVWDKNGSYSTYTFIRQPQSFPDVILKDLANESAPPIIGIELKGWYLLAKEREPSLRFTQTEKACADADLIMVVPWVLSSVISGHPIIFTPFIESAKFAARHRNYHWQSTKGDKGDNRIDIPKNVSPYPKKSDETTDTPHSDKGGNFGRIARTGIMDEYLALILVQPVCGIKAIHWIEFFNIFHQDATDDQIAAAFQRLRKRVDELPPSPAHASLLAVLTSLEEHWSHL